jgi:hypothetical protein
MPAIRKRREAAGETGERPALRISPEERQVALGASRRVETGERAAVRDTGEFKAPRAPTGEFAAQRVPTGEFAFPRRAMGEFSAARAPTGEHAAQRLTGERPMVRAFEAGASGLMMVGADGSEAVMGGSAALSRSELLSMKRIERMEELKRTRELNKAQAMVQLALQQAAEKGDKAGQAREQERLSLIERRQRQRTRWARQQALLAFGGVFGGSWALVALAGLGQGEMSLSASEPMIYLRAGLMLAAAGGITLGWRREPLKALGLRPQWVPALMAAPLVALLAVIAGTAARFDVGADASVPVMVSLLALRAVAEAAFFQGVVTRLLTRSLPEPALGIFASAAAYGLYASTYAVFQQGSGFEAIYAGLLYFMGIGLPMAAIYHQSRSVLVVALYQLVILGACALSGLWWAQSL